MVGTVAAIGAAKGAWDGLQSSLERGESGIRVFGSSVEGLLSGFNGGIDDLTDSVFGFRALEGISDQYRRGPRAEKQIAAMNAGDPAARSTIDDLNAEKARAEVRAERTRQIRTKFEARREVTRGVRKLQREDREAAEAAARKRKKLKEEEAATASASNPETAKTNVLLEESVKTQKEAIDTLVKVTKPKASSTFSPSKPNTNPVTNGVTSQ